MRTLNFWVLPNSKFLTVPDLREVLRDFLREHPEIKIDIHVKTAGSLWRQLFSFLKTAQKQNLPDLIQIPDTWTPILIHLGLLQDLSEIDSGITLERCWAPLREHCSPQGGAAKGIYSLPWWMELRVLYYRKDVMDRLEVDAQKDLETWAGLKEVCQKIQKNTRRAGVFYPIANSNSRESVSLQDLAPCVWSAGGELFSRDNTRSLFQREECIQGMSEYLQLLASGWMPLLGKSGLVPKNLFDGFCALQIWGRFPRTAPQAHHRDHSASLIQNLGVTLIPKVSKQHHSVVSAQHLVLLKNSLHHEEAYSLLKYLVGSRNQERYANSIGAFPCTLEGLAGSFSGHSGLERGRAKSQAHNQEDEFREAFLKSAEIAKPLPSLMILGSLERIFDRTMENLVRAILRRNYNEAMLRKELIHTAAEADYILSLYA
ncbi:MAG: extracellular solute-binding protein [Elusimicrobia bacterium]|nr:extracellular solute-binding protein [Elusimicrobiota bacterium]